MDQPTSSASQAPAQWAINKFFEDYEDRFNRSLAGEEINPQETAAAFADYFVEASPAGVQGGENDKDFLASIPEGIAFYKKIGTQRMNIVNKTIIPLDAQHVVVKVHWTSDYFQNDKTPVNIEFDVTYFLQFQQDGPKIFGSIHGDEQKALRENGLI